MERRRTWTKCKVGGCNNRLLSINKTGLCVKHYRSKRNAARHAKEREKLREYERIILAQRKPGPTKLAKEKKRYFKVGQLVEAKIAKGLELTAARNAIAQQLGLSYSSVARYHKQFREVGSG